jgi:hypothetical protein
LAFGADFLLGIRLRLLVGVCLIPFLVVNEYIKTGDPEIPGRLVFRPEFVDALFGDEFELECVYDFDVFDFLYGDALLDLLECLIGIVGEGVVNDNKISFLPDREQS